MLIKRLDRLATGRHVIATLVGALALLLAANAFSSYFYDLTGGHGLLDLAGGRNASTVRTGYTPDDAYALLTRWGRVGRHDQLLFTLTIDVLVPPATWLLLMLALLYVTRPFAAARWQRLLAVLLPTAYLAFDYGENVAILAVVSAFPNRADGAAAVGGAMWTGKTVTSDLAVCALLVGLIIRLAGLCVERQRPRAFHQGIVDDSAFHQSVRSWLGHSFGGRRVTGWGTASSPGSCRTAARPRRPGRT